jgi:hypothetical protein
MTYKEFNKFRDDFLHRASSLSDRKSEEYTISNLDKLYNFKHVAERLGITPEQALMTYVLKHVDAICNDAKTGAIVSDESVESRAMDICNYMILYACLKIYDHIPQEVENDNRTKSIGDGTGSPIRNSKNASEPTKWSVLSRTTKA